jgi:Na+-driven multidrug efflux pump
MIWLAIFYTIIGGIVGYWIADWIIRLCERPNRDLVDGFADSDPRTAQLLNSPVSHVEGLRHD